MPKDLLRCSLVYPHVGEELWAKLGHDNTIAYENWPQYDEAKTIENTVEIAVQVNGKIKATIAIARDEAQDSVLAKAREAIEGKVTGNIVKEIYVPGRIVNIVVK